MKKEIIAALWLAVFYCCGSFNCAMPGEENPASFTQVESTAEADNPMPPPGKKTFRLAFDNDIYFSSDNIYTTGWSAELHSAPVQTWESVDAFFLPVGEWGRYIPTLTREGLYYRHSLALGQRIQTPDDLDRKDFIKDDVPYAGALVLTNAWYAFNDDEFRGFDLSLGVVGPASMAEQAQKVIHTWTGSDDPEGWDHQLENEPVLNLGYMRKKKIWRTGEAGDVSGDLALSGDVELGNLRAAADFMVETRYGHNVPIGFVYTPENVGRTMHYDATLGCVGPSRHSLFGSFQVGASVVAHDLFFDGNTWRDSPSVDKEVLVGTMILGLHYRYDSFSVHLHGVMTTDVVKDSDVVTPETNNNYGSITVEYRF